MRKRVLIVPVLVVFGSHFSMAARAASLTPVQFNLPPRDFTCSGTSLAAGDFNNDGISDLICLGYPNTVLPGNGHGGFQPSISFPFTVGGPIIVGDLNADGNQDLIVLNGGDTSVYLGNGDGTFRALTPVNYGAATMMVAGDINGDGKLDLIVVEQSTPTVLSFLGNGDGTFTNPTTLAFPYMPAYASLVDLNGDGRLDLVAAATNTPLSGYGALMTSFGNGDGTFRTPRSLAVAGEPSSVYTGDFNWDGKQDVVLKRAYATTEIYIRNGDGTFQAPEEILPGIDFGGLIVADFNGDGHPDIAAVLYEQPQIEILLSTSGGRFQSAETLPIASTMLYAGNEELAIGNFNHDSNVDLVAGGDDSPVVSVLLGNGNGTFKLPTHYGDKEPRAIALTDLDGDGRLDIVTSNFGGGIETLLGNGNGTFQPAQYSAGAGGILAVGDVNGDGKVDAVTTASGYILALLGTGNGKFEPPIQSTLNGFYPNSIALGDFDGDGKLDAIVCSENTLVYPSDAYFLKGEGSGAFAPPVYLSANINGFLVTGADVNGDGKLDLLQLAIDHEGYGGLYVFLGNGDGTFQPGMYNAIDAFPASIAVADVNGDVVKDVIISGAGSVGVLFGNGDGTFQPDVSYNQTEGSGGVAIADFNGDGSSDLAVTGGYSSDVSIMLNNGDGTFQVGTKYLGAPAQPVYTAAGDLNGDGKPDLVAAGQNGIFVFLNMTK